MDELVESVSYYNKRPILLHGYVAPFFLLQAIVFYYFTRFNPSSGDFDTNSSSTTVQGQNITLTGPLGDNDTSTSASSTDVKPIVDFSERHSFEIAVIAVAVSIVAQLITYLFCHWSIDVKCWLSYSRCKDPFKSKYVKVTPTPNNGSTELVPLQRGTVAKRPVLWFVFQKAKYVYDEETEQFKALEFSSDQAMSYYKNWKGYQEQQEIHTIEQQYGRNELDMVIPEFGELFKERATAPFFVFQIFCVGLWCLDEFWYYAVFTLFMLVTFEILLVKHQLRNMQEIRRMGNQPYMIQVFRQQKWKTIRSDQLIHGDLVAIVRSEHSVPCDILLVRGSCIVDESMLTGESIPQMKEPIECSSDDTNEKRLDINMDKLHVLFGGTKVLQHTAEGKEPGCVGYVVRTGFQTSQGKLLRTILFGVKRVTANNFETFCFIMFLLFFAVVSAYYVWTKGIEDPKRSRYRLFYECTIIVTSVVPPELPIELSLAVNSSLQSLSKLYIYCTEPFRIPFAGKVEYCCFDKTGTLTSNDLIVEGVAGLPETKRTYIEDPEASENKSPTPKQSTKMSQTSSNTSNSLANHKMVIPISQCPIYTQHVLASCHSLAHFDDKLVGDPLEKKVLEAIEWNFSKSGCVTSKRGRAAPLKIHQRYHFSSLLKRMSVIASYKMDMSNENVYICTAKGAPEFMRPLMKELPSNYDEVYQEMSRLGARVLALGYKTLGPLTNQEVSEMKRDDVEKDLMFAGFVLISCPLKPDSKDVCAELKNSSHRLVMITGDGALTACHVARVLSFVTNEVLILTKPEIGFDRTPNGKKGVRFADWTWISADKKTSVPFDKVYDRIVALASKYDLCITGDSMEFVMKNHRERVAYDLVRRVKVFARVSPKQKEQIITMLKKDETSVLMCGDGTNDVGALKHADVGVALLSTTVSAPLQRGGPRSLAQQQQQQSSRQQPGSQVTDENASPKQAAVVRKHQGQIKAGNIQSNRKSPSADERKVDRLLETQAKLREMLEEQERGQFVKLGDASIAAPFTSRLSSTQCITHIIKQGRCTLVTTLQMFKILALNALLSAYCHSVLYLDGIKFSDSQVTVQGVLSTFCFLFITRSQPLKKLSARRPLPNIFNLYTILTVTLQFAVHFSALVYLYSQAKIYQANLDLQSNSTTTTNATEILVNATEQADPESINDDSLGLSSLHTEFKPSLINSTVYIIWMSVQLATFAVNYKGHPFMQDLRSNRPLCYSLIGSAFVVFACVNDWYPGLTEQLSVVEFPLEYRPMLLGTIVAVFMGSFLIDRLCEFLFGRVKLTPL